jgi:competence protein ComEA
VRPSALRAALLALVASLFLPLFWKGRGTPNNHGSAAFLRYTSGKVLVRVSGDVAHNGIRQIVDGMRVNDVIKMTIPEGRYAYTGQGVAGEEMRNGDILRFLRITDDYYRISLLRMAAAERILFGIPLDPDQMGYEDWQSLPGIGPKLAELIVLDRQDNGRFGSLAAVNRVPGVGPGKIESIRKFFDKL